MAEPSTELNRLLNDVLAKRANDTDLPRQPARRTPDSNNPMAPTYQRPPRRTTRPYRDPTGEQAIGKIKRGKK